MLIAAVLIVLLLCVGSHFWGYSRGTAEMHAVRDAHTEKLKEAKEWQGKAEKAEKERDQYRRDLQLIVANLANRAKKRQAITPPASEQAMVEELKAMGLNSARVEGQR